MFFLNSTHGQFCIQDCGDVFVPCLFVLPLCFLLGGGLVCLDLLQGTLQALLGLGDLLLILAYCAMERVQDLALLLDQC